MQLIQHRKDLDKNITTGYESFKAIESSTPRSLLCYPACYLIGIMSQEHSEGEQFRESGSREDSETRKYLVVLIYLSTLLTIFYYQQLG